MLLHIPEVLAASDVIRFRTLLDQTEWVDGRVTAGPQSALAKNNQQIAEGNPVAQEIGEAILNALQANLMFMSAALPLRVFPPLFNRYQGGHSFDTHVDNAIRQVTGTPHRIRTDLSATLFLTDPANYDGGELVVEDTYGVQSIKLPAGHMVLYPSTSLHHVTPVTRGARVSSFFWIQSMVRDDARRSMLFDMDMAIQRIAQESPSHPSVVQLTGVYHNLMRQWAEL